MPLFVTIVLDGVGIGSQPDACDYGDDGSNTLGHVCAQASPQLPQLTALGLGCIASLPGISAVPYPRASFGRMTEVSAGKDSTSGHWELAGIRLDNPFPTYPNGFPDTLIERLKASTGVDGILGNCAASGTVIVGQLGEEHLRTGYPIVYTSADSVLQVAAHVNSIPLPQLYALCRLIRDEVCIGPHAVGRVIARPFDGAPNAFHRRSEKRRDYALKPPSSALPRILQSHDVRTYSVGKVFDLFAGYGFDATRKTSSNAEGVKALIDTIREAVPTEDTFVWANLVDFDQDFGHRNDVAGFARCLEKFDAAVNEILGSLPRGARLVITADHGNDPTFPGTDHTREYVPLLYFGGGESRDLGTRATFADHAATVLDFFDIHDVEKGGSFL